MPHDDFLRLPPPPTKKQRGKRSTGFVLRTPDGTCAMLDFATGNVEVWNVGGLPKDWETSSYKVEIFEKWNHLDL